MDPNKLFGSIAFNDLILWILSFVTVVGICDAFGLLPDWLSKYLFRNRYQVVLRALRELGVGVAWDEEKNSLSLTARILDAAHIKDPAYRVELRRMLLEDTFNGKVEIGQRRSFTGSQFVDVMGASTEPRRAEKYARLLHTHLSRLSLGKFDAIATPRTGSPLLGYEFAKSAKLPLVVGTHEKVAADIDGAMGAHADLDFPKTLELKGRRVLLVDDSTTGGTKLLDLAEALRKQGARVDAALVLFEPQGKGSRSRLLQAGIELHSIELGPAGTF